MKYKSIKLKNGDVYCCPWQQESATERSLNILEQIIIELSERIEELENYIDYKHI